ncbi:MAG: oxalurate catabolism protein HpxZ [Beijerinckiaceae bacterium]
MQVDIPEVKQQVEAAFALYETALITNDVPALDALFRDDRRTLRYGIAEILYGMDAIRDFRRWRSPAGLTRRLERTIITTYGYDFATANTLFFRDSMPGKVGRQSQTWVRFDDGWHIVAAHVSVIDAPAPA